MKMEFKNTIVPELGVTLCDTFSKMYPTLNRYMNEELEPTDSRAGEVREILNFKTMILNPYRRCVGGCDRDINIFFLLAEAIWIAMGRKDVSYLTIFNKRMSDFSDDGKTFHAPYGYRLRHWGIRSEDQFVSDNLNASKGYDQVIDAIRLLSENPNTRQVVMSIWNPSFDLGYETKDIPCNDMVMLKIRDGKLITTIQNRSNDLHWGLPTNIFQFSFLTELMSLALGIELGTQTHNSQSLHVYDWNPISKKMIDAQKEQSASDYDLYDSYSEQKIDFVFQHEVAVNKFREIEYVLQAIIDNIIRINEGREENIEEVEAIKNTSNYFYNVYFLLKLYIIYKQKISECSNLNQKNGVRMMAIEMIKSFVLSNPYFIDKNVDIFALAENFFHQRLVGVEVEKVCKYLGTY